MITRMLEVGPGYSPLAEAHEGEFNWAEFPNSDYTAVQPATPWHVFPDDLRALPNVTYIEAPLQSAGLADASFDEVFAGNVLSDPDLTRQRPDMLRHMARVLRSGGLMTLLDTYTPEHGLSAEALIDFFASDSHQHFSLRQTMRVYPLQGEVMQVPSPNWVATAGAYSHIIRHNYRHGAPTYIGRFTQLVKH